MLWALAVQTSMFYNIVTVCFAFTVIFRSVITARRVCIARTMPSQDVRLSVCPSVYHTPVLSLNGYTYPQFFSPSGSPPPTFWFSHTKRDGNIPSGTSPLPLQWKRRMQGKYEKITIFDQYLALSCK